MFLSIPFRVSSFFSAVSASFSVVSAFFSAVSITDNYSREFFAHDNLTDLGKEVTDDILEQADEDKSSLLQGVDYLVVMLGDEVADKTFNFGSCDLAYDPLEDAEFLQNDFSHLLICKPVGVIHVRHGLKSLAGFKSQHIGTFFEVFVLEEKGVGQGTCHEGSDDQKLHL